MCSNLNFSKYINHFDKITLSNKAPLIKFTYFFLTSSTSFEHRFLGRKYRIVLNEYIFLWLKFLNKMNCFNEIYKSLLESGIRGFYRNRNIKSSATALQSVLNWAKRKHKLMNTIIVLLVISFRDDDFLVLFL